MRRVRFRLILPIAFGCLAMALMLWDHENERVVKSMGTAWDTGAPVWPYRAPSLILFAVNAPAYALATPFFFFHYMQVLPMRYVFLLPLILFWWWWIGTRIDFGLLGRRHYRHPKIIAWILFAAVLALLSGGTRGLFFSLVWWKEFGHGQPTIHAILLLGPVGASLWCFLLAGGSLMAGIRFLQGKFSSLTEQRSEHLKFALGVLLIVLYVVAVALFGKAPVTPVARDSCVVDVRTGCVHGIIVDENRRPIHGIEVELVPTDKTGEAKWFATRHEWTDDLGRYSFNLLEPGEYVLAVHREAAPDGDHPFATTYYLGAKDEEGAERLKVSIATRTFLAPLALRRLEVVSIKVTVMWSDGTRPERSNLLFHNVRFPQQAVIGNLAPQVDNGDGKFTLPTAFEYDAVAKVDCDAGRVIESRESKPVQRIKVESGYIPAELTFVIPGQPCKLWKPN